MDEAWDSGVAGVWLLVHVVVELTLFIFGLGQAEHESRDETLDIFGLSRTVIGRAVTRWSKTCVRAETNGV